MLFLTPRIEMSHLIEKVGLVSLLAGQGWHDYRINMWWSISMFSNIYLLGKCAQLLFLSHAFYRLLCFLYFCSLRGIGTTILLGRIKRGYRVLFLYLAEPDVRGTFTTINICSLLWAFNQYIIVCSWTKVRQMFALWPLASSFSNTIYTLALALYLVVLCCLYWQWIISE